MATESHTKTESDRRSGMFLALGLFLTPIVILFMFWQFYYLGDRCSESLFKEQVSTEFGNYPRVKIWLKEQGTGKSKEAEEWEKGCYKLLLRTKDHLYLFYPDHSELGSLYSKNPIEIIPQSDVKAVRVLPVYSRCKE